MEKHDIPNMDAMSPDELDAWCKTHRREASHHINGVLCVAWHYAFSKSCAMRSRLAGNIATALQWEADCQRRYAQLPVDVRW